MKKRRLKSNMFLCLLATLLFAGVACTTATKQHAPESVVTPGPSATVTTEAPTPVTASPVWQETVVPSEVKCSVPVSATAKKTQAVTTAKVTAAVKATTATTKPTATANPTTTPAQEIYQTITYEGKTYNVLMGRNGNPCLILDYSTLPEILQAYAYPTFDPEAIRKDITTYAKTVGFTRFGNPTGMTKELADTECSWDSPHVVGYMGDGVYEAAYAYSEIDDVIALREGFQSTVKYLAEDLKQAGRENPGLCLWFQCYGDSSYRQDFWDDGLYNGKTTKEYAVYFMYGWGDGVEDYVI